MYGVLLAACTDHPDVEDDLDWTIEDYYKDGDGWTCLITCELHGEDMKMRTVFISAEDAICDIHKRLTEVESCLRHLNQKLSALRTS